MRKKVAGGVIREYKNSRRQVEGTLLRILNCQRIPAKGLQVASAWQSLRTCNTHPEFSGEMEDRFGQHGGVGDALLAAVFQRLTDKYCLPFGGSQIAA